MVALFFFGVTYFDTIEFEYKFSDLSLLNYDCVSYIVIILSVTVLVNIC